MHQSDVRGSLGSAVMWMLVIVARAYSYKILFLFNVIDYSRFLKSVFFHVTLLPCIPITCPPTLPLLRKEPAFVKLWTPSGKLVVMAFESQ